MLPISVCMIVKNEEKTLSRCLDSVKPYDFEIVIVDTGSEDSTMEIAKKYTDKVYSFTWCDDFSKARNYSIDMAQNCWVFMLDADEMIEELDIEELNYFMSHLGKAVGAIHRKNLITVEGEKRYQIDQTERFYSKEYYHYAGRIHEQLVPRNGKEMPCYLLNGGLWHDGYDMTEEERKQKAERNISLLYKQMEEEGENPYLCYQLGKGYEIREEYSKACYFFSRALEYQVDPELAYVQEMVCSYGDDLLRTGQKEIALGLEGVYALFCGSADFLYLMGRIYQENKQMDKALYEYQKAIDTQNAHQEGADSYLAHFHMAMIYDGEGRIGRALESLQKCEEYRPALEYKKDLLQRQEKKSLTVFVATHVSFQPPQNPIYVPLHVGREGKEDLGYIGDNLGENISDLNCLYGELTGLYWIWQNITDIDYIGFCHYRRYFLNKSGIEMQRMDYLELLTRYDVIIPKHGICDEEYRVHYGRAHNIRDLEAVGRAVNKLYPDYYQSFQEAITGNIFYSGNLCVMSLPLLKAYAEWLFNIFAEAAQEIDVSGYDAYHRRVYGFLSEQMLYVFILKNQLSYVEAPVGILGEKAETVYIKQKLWNLIAQRKLDEAQRLFEEYRKERPDVLLPGSDVFDELRLTYQILHLCKVEKESGKETLLSYSTEPAKLLEHYKHILRIIIAQRQGEETREDREYLQNTGISEVVLEEIRRCMK